MNQFAILASDRGNTGGGINILLVLAAILYFIPAFVAWIRRVPNIGSVVVVLKQSTNNSR